MRHLIAAGEQPTSAGSGKRARRDFAFGGIEGESRGLRSTIEYVRRLAESGPTNLLLVGAPGTGKALFARAFHYAGPGASEPFLTLDCRATPEAILETELFGHEAGAFEGANDRKRGLLEVAGSGTVFIRHVANLPPRLQPKLLKAITERNVRRVGGREEYEVKCSMVASTMRPLEQLVAEQSFREDLYVKLNETRVSLPKLKDRGEDVVLLANYFLHRVVREQGLLPITLTADAIEALLQYDWPGNVRELRSVIVKATEASDGMNIRSDQLSIQKREFCPMLRHQRSFEISVPFGGRSLKDVEAEVIQHTLMMTEGNQSAATRILGISRPTLTRKIREYGLAEYANRLIAPSR